MLPRLRLRGFRARFPRDPVAGDNVCAMSVPGNVTCGNARHPLGAWHPAASIPFSSERREIRRQDRRRAAWGCGCPALDEPPGRVERAFEWLLGSLRPRPTDG